MQATGQAELGVEGGGDELLGVRGGVRGSEQGVKDGRRVGWGVVGVDVGRGQ